MHSFTSVLRAVIFGIAIALVGCASAFADESLGRDVAQRLIDSSRFATTQSNPVVWMRPGAFSDGVRQGYWSAERRLTVTGAFYFSRLVDEGALELFGTIKRRVLAVTGVADAMGMGLGFKEAYFDWEYTDVTDPTRRFIVRGGTGTALFRLFDDGWRMQDFQITQGKQGFDLSAGEIAAIEVDIQLEAERQAELAAAAEAERLAEEQRQALIEQSRNIGATLGTYTCLDYFTARKDADYGVTLYDVGVRVTCGSMSGGYWFGNFAYQATECGQSAMGWTKPCVILQPPTGYMRVIFATAGERDTFAAALEGALRAWQAKYPGLT